MSRWPVRHRVAALGPALCVLWLAGCAPTKTAAPVPASTPEAPLFDQRDVAPEMVYIPAGILLMGDHSGNGYPDERPVHAVAIDGFLLDRTEVTWSLWDEIYRWALVHGYAFEGAEDITPPLTPQHPVCNVTWHDAVKWANARSERSARRPVYYSDASRTTVYRRGLIDLTPEAVDGAANGYRLPTEAEWEWAARGGLVGQHYPWPSPGAGFSCHLDGGKANYWQSGDPYESEAACATTPVAFFDGRQQPPGERMANGYGLYDMAGNVAEWCWDLYHDQWYAHPDASAPDTRGPVAGYGRVLRGGSWISSDKYCRVAARYVSEPGFRCHCYGLRLAALP